MKLKPILTIIILGTVLSTQAQVLPSPTSQGNVKNGTNPVSLFSGTISMGIPLYTATANNGAGVPVSIGYNASGIKVSEIAGPVGLGWQLYAGGSITRVTRGIPDEYGSMVNDPSTITSAKIQDILDGKVDSEKDLFFFNLPGRSGKFILTGDLHGYAFAEGWCDWNYPSYTVCMDSCRTQYDCAQDPENQGCDTCHSGCISDDNIPRWVCEGSVEWTGYATIPYSDLKIKYSFSGYSEGDWKITDSQGVVYLFESREGTTSSSTQPNGSVYEDAYTYVSTWYLTSIAYPNVPASDGITFSYTNPYNLTTITSEFKTLATGTGSGSNRNLTVSSTEEIKHKTEIGQRFISSINFPKGSINFTYDDRADLTGGKRLTQVDLKDKQGNTVSSTVLNQSYFSANKSYKQGGTTNCGVEETCRRLKLESVYRDGGLVQAFTYRNEEGYGGTGVNYYELPPRDSYYFDHWGYWNAGGVLGNNYEKYPRLLFASVPELPGVDYQLSSGVDRVPYSDYAQANILTRIDYPTGGYTKYAYTSISSQGGVKVSSIKNYDASDQLVSGSSYNFAGPTNVITPTYHYMYDQGADKLAIYQQAKSSALGLNGPSAGYNTATVTDLMGQGKTVYTFNNDIRSGTTSPTRSQWGGTTNNYSNQGSITNIGYPPYPLYSMIYHDHGSYDKVQTYDAANNLVSEKIYTFDPYNIVADYTVSNLALEFKKKIGSSTDVYLSKYDIAVRTFRPITIVDKFYDSEGSSTTTTTIAYHGNHKTLRASTTSLKNDGYGSKTLIKYPDDVTSSTLHDVNALNSLADGIPVQLENQIHMPDYSENEYKTTGVTITSFKTVSGLKVPDKTYALPLTTPVTSWSESSMELVNHMASYNSDGLVTQQVGLDGITTNYSYDSDGYLTQTEVNGRTTDYLYNPLVGIEKVTDANDRSVTYEYDNRNRLLLTRNDDNEITTRYQYVTSTDDQDLSAELNIQFHSSQGNKEDFQHNFYLDKINCPYGECTYTWNWGDGTPGATGTSASHTYTDPGGYNVTVTISNPEYASPLIITQGINITNYNLDADIIINPHSGGQLEDLTHVFSLSNVYCPAGECTYTWDWGDGTPNSTGSSPSHWYREPGTYNVTVTLTNGTYNESANVVKSFIMTNYNLDADININPHAGGQLEDLTHGFSLSNVYCPKGGCTYTWNWGDGTPNSTGSSSTHWYKEPGTYNVTVTIANSTYNETANVVRAFGMTNYNLNATVNIAYADGCQYENDSHGFSLSNIYCPTGGCSYSWNWGDGSTGSGTSTSHTYTNDGNYTVTMTITNTTYNESKVLTTTASIRDENWLLRPISGPSTDCIEEPPSANDVRFWINTGTLSTCMANYNWQHSINGAGFTNFANQSNSEAWFPASYLVDAGNHQIKITVTDQSGRTESTTKSFTVSDCSTPPPSTCSISTSPGSRTFNSSGGSSNFTVSLSGASSFSVSDNRSWISTSKSGNTVTVTVPSTTSTRSGTVTVSASGCSDTFSVTQNGPSNPCPVGCIWNSSSHQCEASGGGPCQQ